RKASTVPVIRPRRPRSQIAHNGVEAMPGGYSPPSRGEIAAPARLYPAICLVGGTHGDDRGQGAQRAASMADLVLVGRRHLRSGQAGRLRHEDRVVAEPVRAARRVDDRPVPPRTPWATGPGPEGATSAAAQAKCAPR